MSISKKNFNDFSELIAGLDKDRAWLLEQLDRGKWSELHLDLAALERELGNFLTKASDKIEENRVSLVEMEQKLLAHEFISEAHCLVLEQGGRSIIGVMIVLKEENDWIDQVKLAKVKAIKTYLRQFFEPVLLPKKFRFIQ